MLFEEDLETSKINPSYENNHNLNILKSNSRKSILVPEKDSKRNSNLMKNNNNDIE